jgi:dihydroneopterin aldolase
MDKLFVTGLEFHGHCGITEEERRTGQRLSVDVEISCDLVAAGRSDHIKDTVDYALVCSRVLAIGRNEKFSLVESLAERIAEDLLDHFSSTSDILVRVHKCLPPVEEIRGFFGVEIRRTR